MTEAGGSWAMVALVVLVPLIVLGAFVFVGRALKARRGSGRPGESATPALDTDQVEKERETRHDVDQRERRDDTT